MEAEILPTCRELGIGFVAYGPLARGFLTGSIASESVLAPGDIRREMPRFQGENFAHNAALVDGLKRLAKSERCTPAQLAIAWVMSRGNHIVPIAGTSRRARLEENAAAADLEISAATLQTLDELFPPGVACGVRTVPSLLPRLGL